MLLLLLRRSIIIANRKCNLCVIQDGIRAAKRSIQIEIQVAVHKIYQQLSATLERALQANKHHIGESLSLQMQDTGCILPKSMISSYVLSFVLNIQEYYILQFMLKI